MQQIFLKLKFDQVSFKLSHKNLKYLILLLKVSQSLNCPMLLIYWLIFSFFTVWIEDQVN